MNKVNAIQVGSGYLEYIKKYYQSSELYSAYVKKMNYVFVDKNGQVIKEGDWIHIVWNHKIGKHDESKSFVEEVNRELCVHDRATLAYMDGVALSVEVLWNRNDSCSDNW